MSEAVREWLTTKHCGILGIWIAMFLAGTLLIVISHIG